MRFAIIAAAVTIGLLSVGANAYATDEPESAIGCGHMDRDTVAAINANASAANVDAARDELRQGRDACRAQYFKIGMAHYKKAIALLGAG